VRHGMSRDMAELLLNDLRAALKHLETHPTTQPLTEAEMGGFHH